MRRAAFVSRPLSVLTFSLLACAFLLVSTVSAGAQTSSMSSALQARPIQPQPVGVNVTAGDDAWMTPPDGGTTISFENDPLAQGFFGSGSHAFDEVVALKGVPLTTNPPGALGVADTIVRRLGNTGPLLVGDSATVAIEFIALQLASIQPLVVSYNSGTELWDMTATLSPSAGQSIGTMTITLADEDGGTYDSTLLGKFLLTFTRVSPLPEITRTLDCGLGQCTEMSFTAPGATWALIGGASNFQPGDLEIDDLDPGVDIDVTGDGIPDGVTTIGRSNLQVGVRMVGGGSGGGGEGECNGTDHINGQSKIETHTSFLAGDSDADGKPNDCDDCTDADEDGVDDLSGETCGGGCEAEPTREGADSTEGEVSAECEEPVEI